MEPSDDLVELVKDWAGKESPVYDPASKTITVGDTVIDLNDPPQWLIIGLRMKRLHHLCNDT